MLKYLFPMFSFLCFTACAPPTKSCDYPLFASAWHKIAENYVEPITNERLFSGALKATEHELGKSAPLPKYEHDARYTPANLWLYHLRLTKKLPSSDTCYSMIKGIVRSLNSRHSIYLKPTENFLRAEAMKELGGTGFLFYKEEENDPAIIYKVFEHTDADLNGVQPGDIIIAIDDAPVKKMSSGEITYYLRGKIGSFAEITVLTRDGTTKKIDLTREKRDQSAYCENLPEQIPYCAILDFDSQDLALTFFKELWKKTNYKETSALILDLRFNPGGYVSQAIYIAGFWTNGKKIMTTKNRKTTKEISGPKLASPILSGTTVILMNKHTASAAEIVIGALQDNGLAITVGEQTYGKGEIQNIIALADGSCVLIVSSYWYPPSGNDINHVGIPPSYSVKTEVKDLRAGHDPQLEAALGLIR